MKRRDKIKIDLINCELKDKDKDDEKIESLAEAINSHIDLLPIVLKENDGRFDVLTNENILKAHILIGDEEVEAIILDDEENEEINTTLLQNMQRNNKSVIDEAMAMYKILIDENISQDALARRLGLKQSTVANKLRLLRLPDYIKEAINDNVITERHGRALLKVESDKLEEVFRTIIERKYNVKKTEEYIKALNVRGNRGVSNNIKIGLNTINEAYNLCKKSGLDCDMLTRESDDEVKVIIRFRK